MRLLLNIFGISLYRRILDRNFLEFVIRVMLDWSFCSNLCDSLFSYLGIIFFLGDIV